jgi:hypothetical protein
MALAGLTSTARCSMLLSFVLVGEEKAILA